MSTTTQQPGDPAPAQPTVTVTSTPVPAAPKPTPPEPKAGDQPKTEDEPLGPGGKKALDAERTARETAEKALAALQREVEDSKKTAEQKAAENAARALRYEVAADKGLDLALASRLTGATREELEADADVLKGLIPTPEPTAAPGAQPVPTIGKTPPSPTGNVSLGDQIAAAEAAGDKALVGRLKAMQLGQSA